MPGDALLDLVRTASPGLLLVAPYIKAGALKRVLEFCPADVVIHVVTRWKLEELALGVNDIEVWPLLKERQAKLSLHPRLHAKFYASGDTALIGSANLTHAALGWGLNPNLEILSVVERARFEDFEQSLCEGLVPVDDALYRLFMDKLAAFPPPPPEDTFVHSTMDMVTFEQWRPASRQPQDLYPAYSREFENLTTASRETAVGDLAVLRLPLGLSRAQFDAAVCSMLRQHPEVAAIDALASEPQRFGAFRSLLSRRGASDGAHSWQTWMRWLLHFFPESYQMREANYSEIFSRISPSEYSGSGTVAASIRLTRD